MPPKRTSTKRVTRGASPRRRVGGGNVAAASEQRHTELMHACVESAQRLSEMSLKAPVRQQREMKKLLTLLQEAREKRPALLRSGKGQSHGLATKP